MLRVDRDESSDIPVHRFMYTGQTRVDCGQSLRSYRGRRKFGHLFESGFYILTSFSGRTVELEEWEPRAGSRQKTNSHSSSNLFIDLQVLNYIWRTHLFVFIFIDYVNLNLFLGHLVKSHIVLYKISPLCVFQAKIVDEHGSVLPVGVSGEVCTRGTTTMLGYWGDDEKTKSVISSTGWYHTGWVTWNA